MYSLKTIVILRVLFLIRLYDIKLHFMLLRTNKNHYRDFRLKMFRKFRDIKLCCNFFGIKTLRRQQHGQHMDLIKNKY